MALPGATAESRELPQHLWRRGLRPAASVPTRFITLRKLSTACSQVDVTRGHEGDRTRSECSCESQRESYSNANAGRAGVRVVLALGGLGPLASTLLARPRGGSVPARSPDLFRVGAVPVRLDRLASEARSGPACGTSVSLEDTDRLRRGRTCGRSVRALAYHGADSL